MRDHGFRLPSLQRGQERLSLPLQGLPVCQDLRRYLRGCEVKVQLPDCLFYGNCPRQILRLFFLKAERFLTAHLKRCKGVGQLPSGDAE